MLTEDENTTRPWNKACRRLIWHANPNSSGDTPLHIAARKGYLGIAKLLVQGYESAIRNEAKEWDVAEAYFGNNHLGVIPLDIENYQKDIPLIVALKEKHDDLGVYLLSATTLNVVQLKDKQGKTAYQIAKENGCEQSRKTILNITLRHSGEELSKSASNINDFHPSVLKIVQNFASRCADMGEMSTSECVITLVVEGIPMFVKDPKKDAKAHLKEAIETKADWLVKLLLEGDSSLIQDSTPAWQTACEKGHLSTLLAFIEKCDQQEFTKLCQKNKQTPLHHIKLAGNDQYTTVLANPVLQVFKNQVDSGGATPLHRAIERNDIWLVRAFLETKGIELDIPDQNGKTALDLLEEKCIANDNFCQLYKELLANPLMTQELKNRVDNNGATSLHRAIARNHLNLAKALVETKGIKLDIEDLNHETAMDLLEDLSSKNDNFFELYKKLLENPLMTQELKNKVDRDGATSLHRAILQNVPRLVKALIETKGVKLEIKDKNSKTALDLIEERCSSRVADTFWYELYKNLLANPDRFQKLKNRRGGSGATLLHIAIEWDDLVETKTLVERKDIKLNIKDMNGKTALDLIEARCDNIDSPWYELYKELLGNPTNMDELKNRRGVDMETPLHRAIKWGDLQLTKLLILSKGINLNIENHNKKTALDLIEERCNHIDSQWYELYKELLENKNNIDEFKNRRGVDKKTLLHRAIELGDVTFAKTLLEKKGIELSIEDENDKTALDLLEEKCIANDKKFFKLYKDFLANSLTTVALKNRVDNNKDTSLHRAIVQDDRELVKALVETKGVKIQIANNTGKTALDLIEERCCKKSDDEYWYKLYKNLFANTDRLQSMKKRTGSNEAAPLCIALEWDDAKLIKVLLVSKIIKLNGEKSDNKTTLDFIEEKCKHIDSQWYELFKELLENKSYMDEFKNQKGIDKNTPLHRAIKLGDITLAKKLLVTKGVELNIKDKDGKTALDLLDDYYHHKPDWGEMCREIRLDPSHKIFKFKYLQRRTSLKDMHNTLSVVAALLATITFAAGFTVPGGVDNKDGTATLATRAAFLAFSITNTIAMCSSMLVLFTVIGAMIWEAHPDDTYLIDWCVFLLQFSLCGTIVAFMTGVYAIIAPKVMWAGIVVIMLCSLAFCGALYVISFFWPLLYMPIKSLKSVTQLKCEICSGNQANTDHTQQSGNMHSSKTGQVSDGPATVALQSNAPSSVQPSGLQLSENTNRHVMNGASKVQELDELEAHKPVMSTNTNTHVTQASDVPARVVLDQSPQQLQNTNVCTSEAPNGRMVATLEHSPQQLQSTNICVPQVPNGPMMTVVEHNKQQLRNTNGEVGLFTNSQARMENMV